MFGARFLQLTAAPEVQSIPLPLIVIYLLALSLRRSVEMTAHSLTCKQTTNNAPTLIDDRVFFSLTDYILFGII